jgi:4-diphosphocytidyl-2-C-methyl-D-erythritol kinase
MISFPHAKINLGLSVLAKRSDGFHDLETIFYPVPKRDVLEILPAPQNRFFSTGLPIPGNAENNLILKAYSLVKYRFPKISALDIHLHKSIPIGAGMGGGSSDGAKLLQMICSFFDLPISSEELFGYALELGSDCPFFLQAGPCLARGRGEILEPVSLNLSGYSMLLIHSDIKIDTAWAYSKINPSRPSSDIKDIIGQPVRYWRDRLCNVFEAPVFSEFPFLKTIKDRLYASGALYASLTGSGSTLYGIFSKGAMPEVLIDRTFATRIP